MLPDSPNTSETQMSLPTFALPQQNRIVLPPPSDSISHTNQFDDTKQILVENIFPKIYFSNFIDYWSSERLRAHGFTHVVHIDRHLQYKLKTPTSVVVDNNSQSLYLHEETQETFERCSSNSGDRFRATQNVLDLNFGEESFLMTVLPNCYKAVKFIDKALNSNGAILVIDPISDQKCLTIVTGYIMYKNNITFSNAYQRIKSIFKKAELEPFFIRQLYEYEPILQVERAQLRGQSCSREMRSAQFKRKNIQDDSLRYQSDWNCNYQPLIGGGTSGSNNVHYQSFSDNNNSDVVMEQ